jgi:hypothetical protein
MCGAALYGAASERALLLLVRTAVHSPPLQHAAARLLKLGLYIKL